MANLTFSLELKGIDEFNKKLGAWGKFATQGLKAALYQEAELIMGRAKREFVPVDTGALRASGHVQRPEDTSNGYRVVMGFGGPSAPYALKVHEDLETPHRVGSAKYLETPLLEAENGMLVRIAQRIAREVK